MEPVAAGFGNWFEALLPAFRQEHFAYHVAAYGLLLAAVLMAVAAVGTWRVESLLRKRQKILEKALASNPDRPRLAFAENWQSIDAAMLDRDPAGKSKPTKSHAGLLLRAAWQEFRETLVDLDKVEIRNTQRPQEYFDSAVRSPTWLDFCANLFVGAGLLLTFVGLVAALKGASEGVASQDVKQTQEALTHLLAVASTKFVTSIVGVGLSIVLKLVDRLLEHRLKSNASRLCALIEQGLHHIPPQGLAAEQLEELRQQSKQLKSFATELAVAIGDRFNQSISQALAPVALSLENLAGKIEHAQVEQTRALREGAGRAIDGAASGELRALSEVLSGVSAALGNMQSVVSASGDAAAAQISGAAARFEQCAVDMRAAFDDLATRMTAMGVEAAEQSKSQAASLSEAMRASAMQLGEESSRAVQGVFQATETAAVRIGETVAASMSAAASSAGTTMSEAGQRLAGSLDGVAVRAERTGEAFSRIDASLDRHVSSLNQITDRTTSAADSLRALLQAMAQASVTTQQTTTLLREVVAQFEKGALGAKQSLDQTGVLIGQIEAHQRKVNETWEHYKKHFEGVDTHLGNALQKWSDQHREALEVLNARVSGIDGHMGTAVSRLRDTVQPLSDLAEELAVRRKTPQPAE